ncbi:TetR/AcrR family transcriptional regulator [Sinimarinibacterium thermocellulolyticum]|uniref:TetR/AcrR family transcriptional regulator n=1 Tax=Sinimarinibacterium thermocellulolyticum TaxID=3170016 RepID=A0ABV2AB13_9GAMM
MTRKSPVVRGQAPRRAREQRVDEILVAARDVFCEKGYEATAVAEIAARLGVVEGTIYKYFATKRELLLKVLEYWYEQLFGDYRRDLDRVRGHRARLRLLIWRHLCTVRDWPLLCRLMFREVRSEDDYRGTTLHALNRRYTQVLMDVIADGQAARVFRADLPPALLRDLVYGGIEHCTWRYTADTAAAGARRGARRGTLDVDTLADQLTAIVCDGIETPGRAARYRDAEQLRRIAARLEALQPASHGERA